MNCRTSAAAILLLAWQAFPVQAETTRDANPPATGAIEEIIVTAPYESRTYELDETLDIKPDAAALLKRAVGASVVSNGPLTGIAQYRGMSRMRISSRINGQVISPGGPNWMDPPLSYAPAAHLEAVEVHRGISSVGAGMETIGGVVNATTWHGEFVDSGTLLQGRVRAGAASVDEGSLLSAALVAASENHRLKLAGLTERADDADFADGSILPTEYRRDRYDIGYGYRTDAHQFQFDYGRNETGETGTPALPMDIDYIDSDLYGFTYAFAGDGMRIDANLYYSDIAHGMSNYHLRTPPMQAGMYRRNSAAGDNLGFAVSANVGQWRFGFDGHDESHDSDIDNPNNPMFFVTNFNNADRQLLGAWVERAFDFTNAFRGELGLRFNRVESDADPVGSSIGMPPAMALRDSFNAADRSTEDNNFDWVTRVHYRVSPELGYYAGISRKTRSSSYQERYLWLPLEATAGLGDGQTYTGRIDLDPEVAHEVEVGFDLSGERLTLSPRLFYKDVDDYIQGTASTNTAAVMFVRMMNMMNGTANPDPLEFNNVDAELYGFDMDWRYDLTERWSLHGVVNYVRGKRKDVDDDLYRVAPLNGFIGLNYVRANWGLGVESLMAEGQKDVSLINGESTSSGYAVINSSGYWQVNGNLRLSAGVDNIADRRYADHLAGINRVAGNPDLAPGDRLPGYGRSVFARLDYEFK